MSDVATEYRVKLKLLYLFTHQFLYIDIIIKGYFKLITIKLLTKECWNWNNCLYHFDIYKITNEINCNCVCVFFFRVYFLTTTKYVSSIVLCQKASKNIPDLTYSSWFDWFNNVVTMMSDDPFAFDFRSFGGIKLHTIYMNVCACVCVCYAFKLYGSNISCDRILLFPQRLKDQFNVWMYLFLYIFSTYSRYLYIYIDIIYCKWKWACQFQCLHTIGLRVVLIFALIDFICLDCVVYTFFFFSFITKLSLSLCQHIHIDSWI